MEIGPLRITPAVDKVLAVLAEAWPRKMPVRWIAARARLAASTVQYVLGRLVAGRLVNPPLQERVADQPPRAVYWLTGAGRELAAARSAAPDPPGPQ